MASRAQIGDVGHGSDRRAWKLKHTDRRHQMHYLPATSCYAVDIEYSLVFVYSVRKKKTTFSSHLPTQGNKM